MEGTVISGQDFRSTVYGYWAARFGCAIDEFARSGCRVVVDDQLVGKGKLNIYHIDHTHVVRIAPELANQLAYDPGVTIDLRLTSLEGIQTLLGETYRAEVESTLLDYFLDAVDFVRHAVADDFAVQTIDAERDGPMLAELFEACTEEELDEADIILEEPDPVILGLVHGGKMVAYSSHRYWGEREIADIGVLIHPEYRGQGLGKTIVAELCKWCISNDVVPMYRVFDDHVVSRKIPVALGFRELIPIETIAITKLDSPKSQH
jgi:GNAT superfamily N-acetyltransferase